MEPDGSHSKQGLNVLLESPNKSISDESQGNDDSLQKVLTSADPEQVKKKVRSKKMWKDVSGHTSHTKFYKKPRRLDEFTHVTRDEYLSIPESISGSADTFHCIHGPEGKKYTNKGLLKRNFTKNVDPISFDHKKSDECPSTFKWDVAKMLEMMVTSPTVEHQLERLQLHLRDFCRTSRNGYRVDTLDSYCVIMNYLLEAEQNVPLLKDEITILLKNLQKPILIIHATDVLNYTHAVANFMAFMAYLLIRLDDNDQFDIVAKAVLFHLSAPDKVRGQGTIHLRHTMHAAGPVLTQTIARMVAVANNHRFLTFLEITLLLACDNETNCIEMVKENIIETICYRFNPYFPSKMLPHYDINPSDCYDAKVKLGVSSIHLSTTLSVLLVLLKTLRNHLEQNPGFRKLLPTPDCYAQRCFIWAYRYECRAREHRHQRTTLTVIAAVLTQCYGDTLRLFSSILMPDIMTLSVLSELPPRKDWTATVNFTTAQADVQFKKILINFVVYLLKVFPYNKFMIHSRHWFLGLVYLLDPGLCSLRSHWSPALFTEIRKTALQALVCTIPLADPKLVSKYGLIRRLMWYIEWYAESPYELPVLYWCVRVLQVAIHHRHDPEREKAIQDLFDTHGIIILINLCYTLLEQKLPPVERSQAIIALSLRLLTSAVISDQRVTCIVYPTIMWPASINGLARKMLDVVIYSLNKNFIISDRWLISLLNFIWEAIVWRLNYREDFVASDGIYKLLDLITMSPPPVRCIALALVCDIARAGEAIGQLVSWRASLSASSANPKVVDRGATIATLLAVVFREDCHAAGIRLTENGVLKDLDNPIMSEDCQEELYNVGADYGLNHSTPACLAAAELAGSCMSKAFALLHMLTEDLEHKVSLLDESYNLYKNIKLTPKDEATLVLCSHFLTLKLNEVWKEIEIQNVRLFIRDDSILGDFINVGRGWAKEIKRQQEHVIKNDLKKACEQESSLYAFLGRVRLNVALDALRSVRCVARSTEHKSITHSLLHDAVFAHHRRSEVANKSLLRTYNAPLDDQNITGQNVKVTSIRSSEDKEEQGICTCSLGRNVVCIEECLYRKKPVPGPSFA